MGELAQEGRSELKDKVLEINCFYMKDSKWNKDAYVRCSSTLVGERAQPEATPKPLP